MKILQVAPYFYPYVGGQERYVQSLGRHLVSQGHEVHVLTSNYPGSSAEEVIDGMRVTRQWCAGRPLRNPITPGTLLFRAFDDYDVVHAHNEHGFSCMVLAYLRKRAPLALTCHGQLRFGSPVADFLEKAYSRTAGRHVFRVADAIVALSAADAEYIASMGIRRDRIREIPNGIDVNRLSGISGNIHAGDLDGFRASRGLDGRRIVLFAGAVIPRKGVIHLVRAMPAVLRRAGPDVVFVLVGTGESLEKMKSLARALGISGQVRFPGEVTDEELVKYYRSSDLFVLPSLSEGLPTTVLEAMYFGLPVVTTDIPGVRDHFRGLCALVPPGDEARLAEAIVGLLGDRAYAKSLAGEGMRRVGDRYAWEKIAGEYEKVYRSLVEGAA